MSEDSSNMVKMGEGENVTRVTHAVYCLYIIGHTSTSRDLQRFTTRPSTTTSNAIFLR
jgi:hypothetical protein